MQYCHGELLQHAHRNQYGELKFRHGRTDTWPKKASPLFTAAVISAERSHNHICWIWLPTCRPDSSARPFAVSLAHRGKKNSNLFHAALFKAIFNSISNLFLSRRGDLDGKCLVFSCYIKQTVVDIQPNSHLLLPQHLSSVCTFLKDEDSKILSMRLNNHTWLPWTQ